MSAFAPSRAFGKVILLGEHAVVYGHPALAGALVDGVQVERRPGAGRLVVPAWGLDLHPRARLGADAEVPAVGRALSAIELALGVGGEASRPFDYVVSFEVPTGAGLGSSASMAVALARAVAAAHGVEASEALLADAAMASETVIHGKPSGLDHTVALRGGFGLFTRAAGLVPVAAERPVPLVIGHTGRARDTRGRVARVAELASGSRGAAVHARFAEIARLVEDGARAVIEGDLERLGRAMRDNQHHLEELECSSPEIERMCALALGAGATGAKLTGGGGGGCVLAVAPGREEAVRAAWQSAGFSSFVTTVGGPATLGRAPQPLEAHVR